jgi:hypothetical protein
MPRGHNFVAASHNGEATRKSCNIKSRSAIYPTAVCVPPERDGVHRCGHCCRSSANHPFDERRIIVTGA